MAKRLNYKSKKTNLTAETEERQLVTSPWIQRAVPSKYEISIFNKLGESMKGTAPNAHRLQAESRYAQ
jgi:hypothetical protein